VISEVTDRTMLFDGRWKMVVNKDNELLKLFDTQADITITAPVGLISPSATNVGVVFEGLPRNKVAAGCCGVGAFLTCGAHSKRIQVERLIEAGATAGTLVTECPKCQIHFKCALKDKPVPGAKLPELVPDDALDGLDAWREKLEQTAAAHRWSSAAVGLARWEQACAQYLATDRAVLAATGALAAKKDELRGRLSARTAQLRALQARGLPRDPQLEELARQAEATLARRPLPLDALEITVTSFEGGVVDAARRAK
jgi:hypothetical protein